jgi:hypothetical protein
LKLSGLQKTPKSINKLYELATDIELVYVEQKYKRPSDITGTISKSIIQIKVDEQ